MKAIRIRRPWLDYRGKKIREGRLLISVFMVSWPKILGLPMSWETDSGYLVHIPVFFLSTQPLRWETGFNHLQK